MEPEWVDHQYVRIQHKFKLVTSKVNKFELRYYLCELSSIYLEIHFIYGKFLVLPHFFELKCTHILIGPCKVYLNSIIYLNNQNKLTPFIRIHVQSKNLVNLTMRNLDDRTYRNMPIVKNALGARHESHLVSVRNPVSWTWKIHLHKILSCIICYLGFVLLFGGPCKPQLVEPKKRVMMFPSVWIDNPSDLMEAIRS